MKLIFFLCMLCLSGSLSAATEKNQNPVNFQEIREYAGFASAAYQTPSIIRDSHLFKDYSLTYYNNIPELEVSYFLATNDSTRTQIIAVRGTSNIENAIVDVALQLTLDKHLNIHLHNGFSLAARAIYTQIQPLLKKDYFINTTGHSLGGAVALILAMHLNVDQFKTDKIVTFGQPKVSNIAGAEKFRHLNLIRVVTPRDLVPLVPPFDPVDLNKLDIYWHSGTEVILFTDNSYALLEGMSSMLRATKFTQEPLSEDNLKNHQMSLYLSLLDKKIPLAKLVPFKNTLNIFNLFGSDVK